MLNKNIVIKRLQFVPTFEEGRVVVLKRDCIGYKPNYDWSNQGDPYFQEGCSFLVLYCGCSICLINEINEMGTFSDPVDNVEWCSVEALVNNTPDNLDEDQLPSYYGVIKAADFRNSCLELMV